MHQVPVQMLGNISDTNRQKSQPSGTYILVEGEKQETYFSGLGSSKCYGGKGATCCSFPEMLSLGLFVKVTSDI